MKNRLTPSQTQRLIELGVDPSKASGEKVFVDIHPEVLKGNAEYAKPWGFIPTFDLSDILSLLPKELCKRINGIRWDCHLSMYGFNKTWGAMYRLDSGDDFLEAFESPELIDALFELLCWVIKNHPDKIKKL